MILGILLGIAVGHTGCVESAGIALYPVELLDPAASDPFDTDPLLAPAPLDCVDCVERRVALPGGDVATVRAAREPALRLADDQVAFVELASEGGDDVLGPGTATEERFGVYAVLEAEGREAWSAFATTYARHFVLVEIEGSPVDLDPPPRLGPRPAHRRLRRRPPPRRLRPHTPLPRARTGDKRREGNEVVDISAKAHGEAQPKMQMRRRTWRTLQAQSPRVPRPGGVARAIEAGRAARRPSPAQRPHHAPRPTLSTPRRPAGAPGTASAVPIPRDLRDEIRAVPTTGVSPRSFWIVRSISITRAASSMSVTTPRAIGCESTSTVARKIVSTERTSAFGRPAVDQRDEDALAHDARDDRAGQALLRAPLVVDEAAGHHRGRRAKRFTFASDTSGANRRKLLAELDSSKARGSISAWTAHGLNSCCTMRQSTVARWTLPAAVELHAVHDEEHAAAAAGLRRRCRGSRCLPVIFSPARIGACDDARTCRRRSSAACSTGKSFGSARVPWMRVG